MRRHILAMVIAIGLITSVAARAQPAPTAKPIPLTPADYVDIQYEDVYVRTTAGWRFKSRVHVFPNLSESEQFGRGRRGQPAPAQPPAR